MTGRRSRAAALFAGAMGAYKNPAGHSPVDFDHSLEATGMAPSVWR
jgi:hypothetical protein